MRKALFVMGCLVLASAQAETFKCASPSGVITFSDLPCEAGSKFIEIRPSESDQDTDAARREVERQKDAADKAAAENEAARRGTSGAASLPEETNRQLSPELSFPGGSTSGSGAPGPAPRGTPPVRRN